MSNSARQQSIWYKLHIDLPLLLGLLALMTSPWWCSTPPRARTLTP